MKLLAVWDRSRGEPSVGGLLIFLAEARLAAERAKASKVDICFVAPGGSDVSPGLLEAARSIAGVERCFTAPDMAAVSAFRKDRDYVRATWPESDPSGVFREWACDTLTLQSWHRELGERPRLSMNATLTEWARDFIRRHADGRAVISVHLKQVPGRARESNANAGAWQSFFEALSDEPVRFFLIGADPVDIAIRSLGNVIVTAERGSGLAGDLALVQESAAFMGMASGPCQMAMFGPRPYVIFKNPDHHADEMMRELGAQDRFAFAVDRQRILRVAETPEILLREYHGFEQALTAGTAA